MQEEKQDKQFIFYSTMATTIQRFFRGYYERKYKHDFYARKKYLANVVWKNEETLRELSDFQRFQEIEEAKRREDVAWLELAKVAANVHHLCSTNAIPGIYNPPYVRDDMKPQIFNVDVETHLRTTFKANYTWKPPNKDKIDFFWNLSKEQTQMIQTKKRLGVPT